MTPRKSTLMIAMSLLFAFASIVAVSAQESSAPTKLKVGDLKVHSWNKPSQLSPQQIETITHNQPSLPLWSFGLSSSRDGNQYTGVVVGKDPSGSLPVRQKFAGFRYLRVDGSATLHHTIGRCASPTMSPAS